MINLNDLEKSYRASTWSSPPEAEPSPSLSLDSLEYNFQSIEPMTPIPYGGPEPPAPKSAYSPTAEMPYDFKPIEPVAPIRERAITPEEKYLSQPKWKQLIGAIPLGPGNLAQMLLDVEPLPAARMGARSLGLDEAQAPEPGKAVIEGYKDVLRAPLQFGQALVDVYSEGTGEEASQLLREAGKKGFIERDIDFQKRKEEKNAFSKYLEDFIGMTPQIASQWAAHKIGGRPLSMAWMGVQIAGPYYEQLKEEGVDPKTAFIAAMSNAAVQAPMEAFQVGFMFRKLGKKGVGSVIRRLFEGGGTEFITEWMQKYPELFATLWAKKEKLTKEKLIEATVEGMYEGLVAAPFGILGGGAATTGPGAIDETEQAPPAPGTEAPPATEGAPTIEEAETAAAGESAVMKAIREDFTAGEITKEDVEMMRDELPDKEHPMYQQFTDILEGKEAAKPEAAKPPPPQEKRLTEFEKIVKAKLPGIEETEIFEVAPEGSGQVKEVGKSLGLDVVFFRGEGNINKLNGARQIKKGTIYINENARAPYLTILGHESVHTLSKKHADLYKKFVQATKDMDVGFENYVERLNKARSETVGLRELTVEEALSREEFIADFAGQQFGNPEFWEKVNKADPKTAKRLAEIVAQILETMRTVLRGKKGVNAKYFSDLNKAQDALASVYSEFARRETKVKDETVTELTDEISKEDKTTQEISAEKGRPSAIEYTYRAAYDAQKQYPGTKFKDLIAINVNDKAGPDPKLLAIRYATRENIEQRLKEVGKEFPTASLGQNYDLTPYSPRKGEIKYKEYAKQRDEGVDRPVILPEDKQAEKDQAQFDKIVERLSPEERASVEDLIKEPDMTNQEKLGLLKADLVAFRTKKKASFLETQAPIKRGEVTEADLKISIKDNKIPPFSSKKWIDRYNDYISDLDRPATEIDRQIFKLMNFVEDAYEDADNPVVVEFENAFISGPVREIINYRYTGKDKEKGKTGWGDTVQLRDLSEVEIPETAAKPGIKGVQYWLKPSSEVYQRALTRNELKGILKQAKIKIGRFKSAKWVQPKYLNADLEDKTDFAPAIQHLLDVTGLDVSGLAKAWREGDIPLIERLAKEGKLAPDKKISGPSKFEGERKPAEKPEKKEPTKKEKALEAYNDFMEGLSVEELKAARHLISEKTPESPSLEQRKIEKFLAAREAKKPAVPEKPEKAPEVPPKPGAKPVLGSEAKFPKGEHVASYATSTMQPFKSKSAAQRFLNKHDIHPSKEGKVLYSRDITPDGKVLEGYVPALFNKGEGTEWLSFANVKVLKTEVMEPDWIVDIDMPQKGLRTTLHNNRSLNFEKGRVGQEGDQWRGWVEDSNLNVELDFLAETREEAVNTQNALIRGSKYLNVKGLEDYLEPGAESRKPTKDQITEYTGLYNQLPEGDKKDFSHPERIGETSEQHTGQKIAQLKDRLRKPGKKAPAKKKPPKVEAIPAPPDSKLDLPPKLFKLWHDLTNKGAGRVEGIDYKVLLSEKTGGYYFTRTEKGIRTSLGGGGQNVWDKETAVDRAVAEAEFDLTKAEEKPKIEEAEKTAEDRLKEMEAEWDETAKGMEPAEQKPEKTAAQKEAEAQKDADEINDILDLSLEIEEVDPEKWEKIKPILQRRWDAIQAEGGTDSEFTQWAISKLSPKGKPYFMKFITEELTKEVPSEDVGLRPETPELLEGEPTEDVSGVEGERPTEKLPDERGEPGEEGQGPGVEVGGAKPGSPGVGKPDTLPTERGRTSGDRPGRYRITQADDLEGGGQVGKYDKNVAAIKLLKEIESENRKATPEEQAILVKYSGWGGIAQAFDQYNDKWSDRYEKLEKLLTENEYKEAKRSTPNAHYTSPDVINFVYNGLEKMGFEGGRILEPAVGTGHFFGHMPDSMADSQLSAVELDSISSRIASQLYQDADVRHSGYQDTKFPDNYFDLVVSNVPFADVRPYDPKYKLYRFMLHDYYFAKSLDKVRPGGMVAFVTSKGTMDKKDKVLRKYIAERAELVGAVRLPSDAFKKIANTEVTTDVLFLRKYNTGEKPKKANWIETGTIKIKNDYGDKIDAPVNQYFLDNPDMVQGKYYRDKLVRGVRVGVKSDGRDLAESLNKVVDTLPENAISPDEQTNVDVEESAADMMPAPDDVKELQFFEQQGKFFQVEKGQMVEITVPSKHKTRMRGLIGLRSSIRTLFKNQLAGDKEAFKTDLADLNKKYDAFRKKFGALNKGKVNDNLFMEDPEYDRILALEKKKDDKWVKTAIFTKPSIERYEPLEKAESPEQAYIASMIDHGKVDWPYISKLLGMSEADAQNELYGQVFLDPESGWVPSDEYLSGNVRAKLEAAEAAVEVEQDDINKQRFQKNVEALTEAQPEDWKPSQITPKLGAPWIPTDVVEQFIKETVEAKNFAVRHIPETGIWKVEKVKKSSWQQYTDTTALSNKWSTERRDFIQIINYALSNQQPTIVDTIRNPDGSTTKRTNRRQTLLVQVKIEALRKEFARWSFADQDRRDALTNLYNWTYNNIRLRKFEGAHLPDRLPGMSPLKLEGLRPHQKDAIWRILQGGNVLLDHKVGSGKTYTMIGAAMEMKRLGMAKKPLFVVPKPIVEQFAADFRELYPSARILSAKLQTNKKQRNKMMARITTGNWDAVIVTQPQFELLAMSKEAQQKYIEDQIDMLEIALERERANDQEAGHRNKSLSVKQIEKAKERLEAKLQEILDAPKDDMLTFEELGVDYMFVDEAHNYKNLFFTSRMNRVPGVGANKIVQKTADMELKTNYLTRINNGRGVVFSTGTPISNSVSELWVMSKYLAEQNLKDYGLGNFDQWAATFGDLVTEHEIDPTGAGFRQATRFRSFSNLTELQSLYRMFSDVVQQKDIEAYIKIPKLKGGKIKIVEVEATEAQRSYVAHLAERAEAIRSGRVDPRDDNMLAVTTDGRKSALDGQLSGIGSGNKLDAVAKNVVEVYKESPQGNQLVFVDVSSPKKEGIYDAYNDLKTKLLDLGVKKEEIAFMHDAGNSDAKRAALMEKFREGDIKILLGSSAKMGEGANLQDKVVAIHHVDAPWKPAQIEQRNGRAFRQGNENDEVAEYRYVTTGTFDAYMWQILEYKANFIEQIKQFGVGRTAEGDIDSPVLSYGEVKALASENPLVFEMFKARSDLTKLEIEYSNWQENLFENQRALKQFPEDIKKISDRAQTYKDALAIVEANPVDPEAEIEIEVEGETYTDKKEARGAVLGQVKKAFATKEEDIPVAKYRGIEVIATNVPNAWGRKIGEETPYFVEMHYGDLASGGFWDTLKPVSDYVSEETASVSYINTLVDRIGGDEKKRTSLTAVAKVLDDQIADIKNEYEQAKGAVPDTFEKQKELDNLRARVEELAVEIEGRPVQAPGEDVVGEPFYIAVPDPDADLKRVPGAMQVEGDEKKWFIPQLNAEEITDPDIAQHGVFFIHKNDRGEFVISDAITGLRMVKENLKKDALQRAKWLLEDPDRVDDIRRAREDSEKTPWSQAQPPEDGVDLSLVKEEENNIWYSKMQRFVDDNLQNKGSATAMADTLAKWAKSGKYRTEELEWSGVEDWLRSKKGKITKAEIVKYLDDNSVRVEDVLKGEDATLFSKWQEPGGENYRELLLQLGAKRPTIPKAEDLEAVVSIYPTKDESGMYDVFHKDGGTRLYEAEAFSEEEAIEHALGYLKSEMRQVDKGFEFDRQTAIELIREDAASGGFSAKQNMAEAAQRTLAELEDWTDGQMIAAMEAEDLMNDFKKETETPKAFTAGHYHEPNVLAHVRFNERVDDKGDKVLFIEEIQSDWHQMGRKVGYQGKKTVYRVRYKNGDAYNVFDTRKQAQDVADKLNKDESWGDQMGGFHVVKEAEKAESVPDAPFKKTWPLLSIKRMVRWGAENGFDKIAWTPGEVQAKRYDLSKQVKRIEVTPRFDTRTEKYTRQASIILKDSTTYSIDLGVDEKGIVDNSTQAGLTGKPLSNVVGKEVADKIMAFDAAGELKTKDMKIGGEGMIAFYDKMLPSIANKFFSKKTWGKAKAETTILPGIHAGGYYVSELPGLATPGMEGFEGMDAGEIAAITGGDEDEIQAQMDDYGEDFEAASTFAVIDPDGGVVDEWPERSAAEAQAKGLNEQGDMLDTEVWSLPITPEMREKSMKEGLELSLTVPEFTTTQDAIAYAKNVPKNEEGATIAKLKALRDDAIKVSNEYKDADKWNEAMEWATKGQFYREAIETIEGTINIPNEDGTGTVQLSIKKMSPIAQDYIEALKMTTPSAFVEKGTPDVTEDIDPDDPDVKERMAAAKGIPKPPFIDKLQKAFKITWHSLTRHRPYLDPKEQAQIADILRLQQEVPENAKRRSFQVISNLLKGMKPKQYDLFSRVLIMEDMRKDIKSGLLTGEGGYPFGFKTKDDVKAYYNKILPIAEADPIVKDALRRREEFNTTLKKVLVKHDLLPKSVLDDPAYWHHQVLEYRALKEMGKTYQGVGVSAKDVRLRRKGWQIKRKGSIKDYNTEYAESEFEVISQAIGQLETKETLKRVKALADATDALKAKAKLLKVKNWKELPLPDGHVVWKPKPNSSWYKANTLTDRMLEAIEAGEDVLGPDNLDQVKTALARGRDAQWIIPEGVAKTLDGFDIQLEDHVLSRASMIAMNAWKKWILINPYRIVKYNLNNMSGDLDIALAYDPRIVTRYMAKAAKDLAKRKKGKALTKEMDQAFRLGVIGSGWSVQEISAVTSQLAFDKHLETLMGNKPNLIKKTWRNMAGFTTYRENILRLAAFRYFQDRQKAGDTAMYAASNKTEIDAIVDDNERAAKLARELVGDYGNITHAGQWLRRHLIPFYSWLEINAPRYVRLIRNIKHEGEGAKKIGRMVPLASAKIAWKGTKLAVKASIIFGLVNLYNHTFWPDEEDELSENMKRQLHLILGRRKDGSIITLRFQGALSDALAWFGGEDMIQDIRDVIDDKKEIGELATEAALAAPTKIINGIRPDVKMGAELGGGVSFFPDPFNPRPVRDKLIHAARLFSLDGMMRVLTGKPRRGDTGAKQLLSDLMSIGFYTSDPGESAYYDIKSRTYDYKAKVLGKEPPRVTPTSKSNALYYYKQALKYGDLKAAQKYIDLYFKKYKGTQKGLKISIARSHPLGALAKKNWNGFLNSLTLGEKERYKKALAWYNATYKQRPQQRQIPMKPPEKQEMGTMEMGEEIIKMTIKKAREMIGG